MRRGDDLGPQVRVALVACSSTKLDHRAPARDLYTGELFVKSAAYVELTCDAWYVLSALHGLVRPGDVLDPYDATLTRERRGPWGESVNGALLDLYADRMPRPRFVFFAGKHYRQALAPHLAKWADVDAPLAGMGYGQQLAMLKATIDSYMRRNDG